VEQIVLNLGKVLPRKIWMSLLVLRKHSDTKKWNYREKEKIQTLYSFK